MFWGFRVILVLELQQHHELSSDDPSAIAAVATVGYTGFVWSPPVLGWIAQTVNLRGAMATIIAATLGIITTGLVRRRGAS